MPITTDPSVNPPQVVVNVEDDGGGDTDHYVNVQYRWNAKRLAYKTRSVPHPNSNFRVNAAAGWCRWARVFTPAAGDDFIAYFTHLKKGPATVKYRAEDDDTGYVEEGTLRFPPPKRARKTAKKSRKKA